MTGKELYELFETGAKIIIRLISEIETYPPVKETGDLKTITDIKIEENSVTIMTNSKEFGGEDVILHCSLDEEVKDFEIVSNTKLIYEYKDSNSKLSYKDWLNEKFFCNETITLELEIETYEKLKALAEENSTTIERIVNNLLELCIKENGIVVWNNGFENPYTVLKTKEEVESWVKSHED